MGIEYNGMKPEALDVAGYEGCALALIEKMRGDECEWQCATDSCTAMHLACRCSSRVVVEALLLKMSWRAL
jgi:hypothetical protein